MNTLPALPSELTIYTVAETRSRCLQWLLAAREEAVSAERLDEPFEIDAEAVAEVDGAGVQLLMALSRSLEQAHRPMRLRHPARQLVDACVALGVDNLLTGSAPEPETAGACA